MERDEAKETLSEGELTRSGEHPTRDAAKPAVTGALSEPVRRDSFAPGMIIAEKYVVERVVGEGGIGIVVAAKHVELEQTVAIKYLQPKAVGNATASDRFLREARLAAKIRSEHVVRVYDVGRLGDGTPYMVMEYLAGTDLGRLLSASGPLTVERAIDYVLQACEALAEAHIAGIVHRDLKPDNLFVAMGAAGRSVVKILDFGISKMSTRRTTSGELTALTLADEKFGTPVYMSPEQLRSSSDVDARADVWAIGVVLYELLTGRLPFDGDDLPELCTAILTMPPVPLVTARASLPASLQIVIERCLEKDCEARYQNVAELAQDLEPFASSSAKARIEHVVRVVREAGESVRPPTPLPDGASARAIHQAATLEGAEAREVLTTGSGAASWAGRASSAKAFAWRRARFLVPAAAAVVAVVVFAIVSSRGHVSPPAVSAASQPEHASAAVADPAPAPLPGPPATTEAPAATPLPNDPRATKPATARPKGRPASTASAKTAAPAPAPFDSTAVINPFD